MEMENCIADRMAYVTLENGEQLRGMIKTIDTKNVVLDDILILDTQAKVGTKKIPKEAISKFFSIIPSGVVPEVVENGRDKIDFKNTRDRIECFFNEVGNITADFLQNNFNFEDSADCTNVAGGLLSLFDGSDIIQKILEGEEK